MFSTNSYYTIGAWSTVPTQFNWSITNSAGSVVASGAFTDAGYTNGYAGMIKCAGDPNTDVCHFDNFYVQEITVPPITQPHPRLAITPADVVAIQGDISNQVQPRYAMWLDLKFRADSWCQQTVAAPYTGGDSLAYYNAARAAGNMSSKMALGYLLEGNTNYEAAAKAILLAWAQATPLPGTTIPVTNNFPDSGMDVARGSAAFFYTYDYLYNFLSPAERAAIEAWFRALLPTIQAGIDRWNTPYKASSTDPRGWVESSNLNDIYFGGQYYQNHLVAHTMGYLLIGYALGDQSLVQFAVDSKANPRSFLTLFDGNILMAGDPYVYSGDPMDPPPQNGEDYDRYRHTEAPGLGLAYATTSLNEMMAMAETLFVNGLNCYTRVGAYGQTMEQPFDFYADFWRLQDSSIKGGFYTGETYETNLWQIAVFEVANKRYPGDPAIQALLNSVDRTIVDPSGYMGTYFCYPTLTHGVAQLSWTGSTSSSFEAAGNWQGAVPANDAGTDIGYFNVTPAHMPQLSASRAIAGIHFGVSGITLSASGAPVLTVGAAGISSVLAGAGTNTVSAAVSLATNQSWNVSASNTLVVSGAISGAFDLAKTGKGTLTLSGANTRTGSTTITAGTLQLGGTSGNLLADNSALILSSGTLDLNGRAETVSSLSGSAGSSVLTDNSAGSLAVLTLTNTTTSGAVVNPTDTLAISGGTLAVGQYFVNNGTLNLAGGTLKVPNELLNGYGASGAVASLNSGLLNALTVSFGNYASTYHFNGGTVLCANIKSRGAAAVDLFFNGVTVQDLSNSVGFKPPFFPYANALVSGQNAWISTNGVTFDSTNSSITISCALQHDTTLSGAPDGGLSKAGPGTLTLSGANTYTGPTIVHNGTLLVSGSLAGGAVSVATNGTLAGNGTIQGATTVLRGGAIQPGLGGVDPSTLTINSSLSLSGNALCTLNKNNGQLAARIVGISLLTYGGTLTVSNAGPAPQSGDSFTLFQAGAFTGGFSATNLPALGSGLGWVWKPANGTLSVVSTLPTTPTNIFYSVSAGTMTLFWPGSYLGWIAEILSELPIFDSDLRRIGDKSAQKCLYLLVF